MRVICLGFVIAASLCAATAGSTAVTASVLRNPGAELGPAAKDAFASPEIPGWERSGKITAVQYVNVPASFPTRAISKAVKGGKNFFAGGPDNAASWAKQSLDVAAQAGRIDRGGVKASLSAWLGGYSNHTDVAMVQATFRSATGQKLGALKIGPVTAGQRGNETKLLKREAAGMVPKGTRTVDVVLRAIRGVGGGYNDGYADNISFKLG